MPLADGDWMRKSCWKANRSHDPLCYRCRTPRGADPKHPGEAQSVSIRGDQLIPRVLVSLPAAFPRSPSCSTSLGHLAGGTGDHPTRALGLRWSASS